MLGRMPARLAVIDVVGLVPSLVGPRLTALLDARLDDYTGAMRFFFGMLSAAAHFAKTR